MIIFADSVRHYSTCGYKYTITNNAGQSSTHGRNNGASLAIGNSVADFVNYAVKTLPSSYSPLGVAFRYTQATNFTGGGIIISFWDGATEQCSIGCDTSGHLIAYKNDNATVLGTSTNTLTADTLYHIEVKASFNNSTGSIEVRVDRTSTGWLNLTGVDTQASANSTANIFRFSNAASNSGGYRYFCDIIAWDTTGDYNNDFIGEKNVDPIYVNAAGTNAEWTPSTGSNYTCIDETTASETDYVSTLTDGNKDSYNFNSISDSATIIAIVNTIIAKKEDAGSAYVKSLCISNSTEYLGDSLSVATAYTALQSVYEVDPNTTALWTNEAFNAAEFGVKYSIS